MTSFKVKIENKSFIIKIDDEYYDSILKEIKTNNINIDNVSNTSASILDSYIKLLTQNIQYKKDIKDLITKLPDLD